MMKTQVLILGAGPAGLMAGIYATRAGLKSVVLTGSAQGGQLLLTNQIENFPGFLKISGTELVENLTQQAVQSGVELISQNAVSVSVKKHPFVVKSDADEEYQCDSLIVATGASPKWLNLPGEATFKGHGISICAVCDGFFYKDKTVMVIGGGNTAAYEALYLSHIAKKVYLVHRRDTLRAEYKLAEQIKNNAKIEILWNTQAVCFKGKNRLSSVVLKTENQEREVLVDGVFEAIGQTPNATIFHGQVERDEAGFIITDKRTMETSVAGVFACGDVQEKGHRQAIIAAASGALAALGAEKYLLG